MSISYVMLGANDPARARAFYEPLLAQIGFTMRKDYTSDDCIFFAPDDASQPMLAITTPYDGQPATRGNGTMIALTAPTRAAVDKVHADALATGGSDEGAPGERMPGFYGAYFRDLDGNKLFVLKAG